MYTPDEIRQKNNEKNEWMTENNEIINFTLQTSTTQHTLGGGERYRESQQSRLYVRDNNQALLS